MTVILEAQQLSKQYRMGDVTVEALRKVNFSVNAGEFVAIMGPSGSGKSTLLHLLGGLDHPTTGDIHLNCKAYAALDDDALTITRRREIGFIFQFFNLIPTLNAAENVALPLLVDGKQAKTARVNELLALVGLADRAQHKPHQLSGGQQQRVYRRTRGRRCAFRLGRLCARWLRHLWLSFRRRSTRLERRPRRVSWAHSHGRMGRANGRDVSLSRHRRISLHRWLPARRTGASALGQRRGRTARTGWATASERTATPRRTTPARRHTTTAATRWTAPCPADTGRLMPQQTRLQRP